MPLQLQALFVPGLRCDIGDLPVGHVRQAGEHVAQVSKGIKAPAAAVFDEGVNDGAALSGVGLADEEPVLFADG